MNIQLKDNIFSERTCKKQMKTRQMDGFESDIKVAITEKKQMPYEQTKQRTMQMPNIVRVYTGTCSTKHQFDIVLP